MSSPASRAGRLWLPMIADASGSTGRMGRDVKQRVLDWFLLVVVLWGGFLAWQSGRERSRLTQLHARLARKTGDLLIADPTMVNLQALATGEPLHFAWRVYFPPNYKQTLSGSTGGFGVSSSGQPSEFIARVRLRQDDQGVLQVYTHFANGSSRSSIGDQKLAEVFRGRWDKIRVEQLGAPELALVKPDQHAVLLRLTLPDDLQDQARKNLSAVNQKRVSPVLFELDLGPKPAPKKAAQLGE